MTEQYCDPAVSRSKFERELKEYESLEANYRRRGWLLLVASYPKVLIAFGAPKVQPSPLVVGALLDFSNYDAAPPSVRLVNPFTSEAYKLKDVPTRLNRALPPQQVPLPGGLAGPDGAPGVLSVNSIQPYMQANSEEEVPFLCMAGVREYHEHPAHSGDVWALHRAQGAGRLVRILEVIYRYGVEPFAGYTVQLVPQVALNFGDPPR